MNVEICVASLSGARAAQAGGANRIELCADLAHGGVTPGPGMLSLVRRSLAIPVHVLIRPRAGDFLYDDDEFAVMEEDIRISKDLGAAGLVFGVLTADGTVDVARTSRLVALARPASVTFHRAFDMCVDQTEAIEALIGIGVERVLTSGGEATCVDGIDRIARLCGIADRRITVMAGGGVTAENAVQIVASSHVHEIHSSARGTAMSRMRYRNPRCTMGSEESEYLWDVTDEAAVRRLVQAVK